MAAENVIIRKAKKEDMTQVCELIRALAAFENLEERCKMTPQILICDGFDTTPPVFSCIVVELDGKIIGYALYFTSYSTWIGKAAMLEDLFIDSNYRQKGLGKKLFKAVARDVQNNSCNRIDLTCLSWNPALEFYKKIGVKNLTLTEDWNYMRIEGDALDKLCEF
ncbi:hypothetical protein FQA39_LY16073 [Lamprigera yunnana]|nr:hypothetical protein FQA39_LY16073 [Lamprigera yunnana]